jgi:glycosyltransferase involved in cell wall biosynthesis
MHKWLVRYSLKRADLVMFSTPDLYPHIARIRPDATFLPNPIDTRGFADNQAETLGGVRVLINLALNPSKAPQIAFEAAREIKRRCPDVEICAIASGPLYSSFQRYRGVRFLDPVPHAEMAQLINSYDVVLGQFLIGSLGMSELESMACAKPVVCYLDTDLYSRWYGEAPPVVSASTADAAAQSAIKLIQDPLWRQDLGRRGREWVVRHHDYRTVAAQMVDHYHGMLVEAR